MHVWAHGRRLLQNVKHNFTMNVFASLSPLPPSLRLPKKSMTNYCNFACIQKKASNTPKFHGKTPPPHTSWPPLFSGLLFVLFVLLLILLLVAAFLVVCCFLVCVAFAAAFEVHCCLWCCFCCCCFLLLLLSLLLLLLLFVLLLLVFRSPDR